MAWSWSGVYEHYKDLSEHPRESWEYLRRYSRVIIEIIPKLRGYSDSKNIQPALAAASLQLLHLEKSIGVAIEIPLQVDALNLILTVFSLKSRRKITYFIVPSEFVAENVIAIFDIFELT